jgi:hypothetical protein
LLRYDRFRPQEKIPTNITLPSSGSKNKPSKKPTEADRKLSLLPVSADFLLGLFFSPQDGGDIILRNARLSLNYTALQPRRLYSLKNGVFEVLHNEQ